MSNPNSDFLPLSRPRLNLRRVLFYLVTIAVLVLVYSRVSEFALLWNIFLKTNLWWLVGIIISQLLVYYYLALNYRDVLKIKDLSISVRELFPVTFVVQFLNQALPSANISGQAFFVQYLKKHGLSLVEGIGRALLELLTLYIAFAVFFLLSALLLFWSDSFGRYPQIAYFIYLFLFFAVLFTAIFFGFQKKRRGRVARWVVNKLHRYFENGKKRGHTGHVTELFDQIRETLNLKELGKHKQKFFLACLWQGLQFFANVFTLYFVGYAVGAPLAFVAAFVVFTLIRFIAMVSFVPGAFGVFEGSMIFVLTTFDTPLDLALAITLLFRAFSFWLPIPIGWLLYRRYVKRWEANC